MSEQPPRSRRAPINAAWSIVTCADCGREYQCTPANDYYHRPDIALEDRSLSNGVCEACLVGPRRVVDLR